MIGCSRIAFVPCILSSLCSRQALSLLTLDVRCKCFALYPYIFYMYELKFPVLYAHSYLFEIWLKFTDRTFVRVDYASQFTSVGAGSMLSGHLFPPHVLCT